MMMLDPSRLSRTRLLTVSLLFFAAGTYFYMLHKAPSLDLMALWLAGVFYQAGDVAQIYPADMGVFTMYPPNAWVEYLRVEYNFTGPVYPYIYPPIWAWLAGLGTAHVPFVLVAKAALVVNVAALTGAIGLTYRLTKTRMNPAIYVGICAVVLLLTPIGHVALAQSQVQILVSFLIILALERSRSNHPTAAGIALALAAALKLYPALFAIFWLATGERRAAAFFALAGASMGALSIFVTGWPLHADFLHQIATISNTVFVTAITVNLDAVTALIFHAETMQLVPALGGAGLEHPVSGWRIIARPLLWKILSNLALLGVFVFLWFGFKRAGSTRRVLVWWPLALTLIPLSAPMTWMYYYIPTALFAATLPGRWEGRRGTAKGMLLLLLGLMPMLTIMAPIYLRIPFAAWRMPAMATLGLLIWCAAFVLSPKQKPQ